MDMIRSRFSVPQQSTESSPSASTSNAVASQTSAVGSSAAAMATQSLADSSGGGGSGGSSGSNGGGREQNGASGISVLPITTATDSRTTIPVAQTTVIDSNQDLTATTVTEYVVQTSGLSGVPSSQSLRYTITKPAETTILSTTTARPVETFTTSVTIPLSSLIGSSVPSGANPKTGTNPPQLAAAQRRGVSSGAAAGIGIGCAILGAILGALVVWALSRKRKPDRDSPDSRITPSDMDEFTSTAKAIPITAVAGVPPVMQVTRKPLAAAIVHARPSTSTSAVISKTGDLAAHVKRHVEEFYHRDFVDSTNVDVDAIEELGLGPYEAARLVILLCSAEDRFAGMSYLIAWTLFSRLELGGDSRKTLLPPVIVDGYISVFNSVNARQRSKWRMATADLYTQKYAANAWNNADERRNVLRKLRSNLASILSPFVQSEKTAECIQDLDTIMKDAAAFGLTLISHPSEFEFVWEDDVDGEILVFPGLDMVTSEIGDKLSSPKHLTRPIWD